MDFTRFRTPLGFTIIIASIALLGVFRFNPFSNEEIRWDMINVNHRIQGDAHLLIGSKNTVLIDTGHARVGSKIFVPYLKSRKVTHIDAVIITHPHHDHYGGLHALLDDTAIQIGRIYMTRPSDEWAKREHWGVSLDDLDQIEQKIQSRNIPLFPVQAFESIQIGGDYYLRSVAAPTEKDLVDLNIRPDINDLSLITVLTNGKQKVLFSGDLNRSFSEHLLQIWSADEIQTDILKFPHHAMEGFASSAFIRATRAKVFMNSMPAEYLDHARGERARQLAQDMNAQVFSNGKHGHVTVWLGHKEYRMETEH